MRRLVSQSLRRCAGSWPRGSLDSACGSIRFSPVQLRRPVRTAPPFTRHGFDVFDRHTEFWDVDGVPVICHGDARCIDARTGRPISLSHRIVSAEEGRCMSAPEFLFVLQLTPGNVYMDVEPDPECPLLPAVVPGHYTLWEFRGQAVVCSPKGFAKGLPGGGYLCAMQVEKEGRRLDQRQFRQLVGVSRPCGLMT
jgi:hypothetical protein